MTVVYSIFHDTRYRYATPARSSVMSLCLQPRTCERQDLLEFAIATEPSTPLNATADPFGNTKHLLTHHRATDSLRISSRSRIALAAAPRPPRAPAGAWGALRGWRDSFVLWDYLKPSALTCPSALLDRFVAERKLSPGEDPLVDLLVLSDALHEAFEYVPGATTAESPVDHVLETGAGVCQDYAHVMIAIARGWGVPARYAMGYLHVTGAPGEQAPQNATHAWVECLLPELGWVGFDPTNRSMTDHRHVRVAVGRDFHDVSPTRGVYRGGGEVRLEVDVRMDILEASGIAA